MGPRKALQARLLEVTCCLSACPTPLLSLPRAYCKCGRQARRRHGRCVAEFGLCVRWLSHIPKSHSSVHFRRSFAAPPPPPSPVCQAIPPLLCLFPKPWAETLLHLQEGSWEDCVGLLSLGAEQGWGCVCVPGQGEALSPTLAAHVSGATGTIAPEEVAPDCL